MDEPADRIEKSATVIRPTLPDDTEALVVLARGTAMFKPIEIEALREVLDDYHAANREFGHRSVTWDDRGRILAFAYYAPVAMTDRTWSLYWIVVAKDHQGRGLGSRLLEHAEAEIRAGAGRLLLIETSSLERYLLTRKFYLKHGYEQACSVTDFYADGDDLAMFRKRLA